VNLAGIAAELESERDRLGRAIAALAEAVLPATNPQIAQSASGLVEEG
jgi:hypothetical protein